MLHTPEKTRTTFTVKCTRPGQLFILPKSAFFDVARKMEDAVGVSGDVADFMRGLPALKGCTADEKTALADVADVCTRSKGSTIVSRQLVSEGIIVVQQVHATPRRDPRPERAATA